MQLWLCDRCRKELKEGDVLAIYVHHSQAVDDAEVCETCYDEFVDLCNKFMERP